MKRKIAVIGGGASGMMAAVTAARSGAQVTLFEARERLGKKLLATGNGKCNYTNLYQAPECYRGTHPEFAAGILENFPVEATLRFFEELGIVPKIKNGYVYPNSEQAASVADALSMELRALCVKREQAQVEEIIRQGNGKPGNFGSQENGKPGNFGNQEQKKPEDFENQEQVWKMAKEGQLQNKSARQLPNGFLLKVTYTGTSARPEFFADVFDAVILCCGSPAGLSKKEEFFGYQLAKALGHSITPLYPALVQLHCAEKRYKTVSGVRTEAKVTVMAEGEELAAERGEILFTDYGLSGIPVFQVSRFAAQVLGKGKQVVCILDLLPDMEQGNVRMLLEKRVNDSKDKTAEELLVGLLNHKLNYVLLKECGIEPTKPAKSVLGVDKAQKKLAAALKGLSCQVTGTNPFANAQVCAGGVDTAEVSGTTLESKLVPGLFFAGELLDIDGTCGGYNLQWAWSSGYTAGRAAAKIAR